MRKCAVLAGALAIALLSNASAQPSESRRRGSPMFHLSGFVASRSSDSVCRLNLTLANYAQGDIEHLSGRLAIDGEGALASLTTVGRFDFYDVEKSRRSQVVVYFDTRCSERTTFRLMRIDSCRIGRVAYSDCADFIDALQPISRQRQ